MKLVGSSLHGAPGADARRQSAWKPSMMRFNTSSPSRTLPATYTHPQVNAHRSLTCGHSHTPVGNLNALPHTRGRVCTAPTPTRRSTHQATCWT